MRIQKTNSLYNNPKYNRNYLNLKTATAKQMHDMVTFTSKNNFVSAKQLKGFVHELAQDYISNSPAKVIGIGIDEYGHEYTEKNNGKIFKFISKLSDKTKAETIKKSFDFIEEFKQFYMHTLKINDTSIVNNKSEALDMLDCIKKDFAESVSLVSDQKLKFKLIKDFLNNRDKNIQHGGRNSIALIQDSKLKDKLINIIASRENAFKMGGEAFNNFDLLLKHASDNLQIKLIKKYITTQGFENPDCYHRISDEQKIKEPQKIVELIKILTPINNFRYQKEIMPLLANLPKDKKEEAFVHIIKVKSKQKDKIALSFLHSRETISEMKKLSYEAKKKILPYLKKNEDFNRLNKNFLSDFLQDNKALNQ